MLHAAALISVFLLAQAYPLPDAVRVNLDQLLEIMNDAYSPFEMERADQLANRFTQLMDELGDQLTPLVRQKMSRLEGRDIRTKLLRVAVDRKQRPSVYREIERQYLEKVGNPQARFPHSPQLRAKHKSETYRLPWEYILLQPAISTAAALYDGNARNALAVIGNDASITTFVHSCRMAAKGQPQLNPRIEERERLVLGGLRAFINQRGLSAILQCLEWTDTQWQNDHRWEPVKYTAQLLKNQDWQSVISGASRTGLNDKQRYLMEQLK